MTERPAARRNRCGSRSIQKGLRGSIHSHEFGIRTVRANNAGHIGLTQPRRRFNHRIEHRLKIEARATDEPEYLGCGGLLVARLGEFAGPLVEVGGGGTTKPRNRWRISALERRRLMAAFFHCCAARCFARAESDSADAAPPSSVMSLRRLLSNMELPTPRKRGTAQPSRGDLITVRLGLRSKHQTVGERGATGAELNAAPAPQALRVQKTVFSQFHELPLLLVPVQGGKGVHPRHRRTEPVLTAWDKITALTQDPHPYHVGRLLPLTRRGRIDR